MGSWRNVAFVQTDDFARVQRELLALVAERGRQQVRPALRALPADDAMQYGLGDEVRRWGIAGFPGARGWTVVRTAPFELLLQGNRPLLAELATRLGAPAFQYNLYGSTSQFLFEVDGGGRIEKSGFGIDPCQYWDEGPPEDRCEVQFHVIDATAAAESAERLMPGARVEIWLSPDGSSAETALLRWGQQHGGEVRQGVPFQGWKTLSLHPAHIVRALGTEASSFLPMDGCIDAAVVSVFGGANSQHCDNGFLLDVLITHGSMPITGFDFYADSDSGLELI